MDGAGRPSARWGSSRGWMPAPREHGLGAVFTDLDDDGRLDVYVANDEDPNRLYRNVPWPGGAAADPAGLGFRLRDVAALEGVADPNAGMGIAAADFDGNGLPDLFVSNSRGQGHAIYRARPRRRGSDVRGRRAQSFAGVFGTSFTGWGASWVDLDLDTDLDLVLANGDIPVTSLAEDAEPIQVLENVATPGRARGSPTSGLPPTAPNAEDQRTRARRGRLRQRRGHRHRDQLDRRSAGPPRELDRGRQLARGGDSTGSRPERASRWCCPMGARLVREFHAGGSYLSSEDPRVLFGLGDATVVRTLVIRYPDGTRTRLVDVAVNQVVAPPAPTP